MNVLRKFPVKKLYKIHVYVGVFVAFHIAIFSVTGLALLFKDEFESKHKQTSMTPQTLGEISRAYQNVYSKIRADYPTDRPLALFPDEENAAILHARIGENGSVKLRGSKRPIFDLQSATEIRESTPASAGFFDIVLRIHRELFLGSNGKLYVGFVGILYVLMLISGFVIYGNFMKGRRLGDIREIFKDADYHKFAGIVTFGWSTVVGFTGTLLAFNGVLIKLFQARSLGHLSERYRDYKSSIANDFPVESVVASAMSAKKDWTISYVSFPDTEFGIPGHFLFLMNPVDSLTERISELVVVEANSAKVAELIELPLYLKAVLLSEPLHFGDYGGIPLKVIWGLFTIASLAVAMFGLASFFRKRSKSKPERKPQNLKPRLVKSNSSKYALPSSLAVISVLSLVAALFGSPMIGNFAIVALCVPILLLFVGKRNV